MLDFTIEFIFGLLIGLVFGPLLTTNQPYVVTQMLKHGGFPIYFAKAELGGAEPDRDSSFIVIIYEKHLNMDPMDVDARVMSEGDFLWKYSKDFPNATLEKAKDEYQKYLKTQEAVGRY
ncbi:hypothetical protein G9A89_007757 [Geosiphon pyriformis]|nr:hypothetical protein G9A89_007757 [Geosiphon pyriformis]